jgi:hypothetical protein
MGLLGNTALIPPDFFLYTTNLQVSILTSISVNSYMNREAALHGTQESQH